MAFPVNLFAFANADTGIGTSAIPNRDCPARSQCAHFSIRHHLMTENVTGNVFVSNVSRPSADGRLVRVHGTIDSSGCSSRSSTIDRSTGIIVPGQRGSAPTLGGYE